MTIAAGFVCSDGLLFASDTLYSGTAPNRYGPKFWHSDWGGASVVFGGAGTEAGLKRTRDEIQRRVAQTTDRYDVIKAVEASLAVVERLKKPAMSERTAALVGIRTEEGYWLYENQDGSTMLNVIDYNNQCVGAGAMLGLYFARSLFTKHMPIGWAKVVAAHLVKQVKTYNDGWCGGDTQLVSLPFFGDVEIETDQAHIAALESHLSEVDNAMRLVIPSDSAGEGALAFRLKVLNRVVRKLRRVIVHDDGGSPSGIELGEWLASS